MYTNRNFKTKKQLKEFVAAGREVGVYSPGPFAAETQNGEVTVEGPHYPEPHRWWARVTLENGVIVKVK
jgi:hypothetical protein